MPDKEKDPAGTTHEFRAFMNRGQSQAGSSGPNIGLIVGIVAVAAAVLVIVALLLLL